MNCSIPFAASLRSIVPKFTVVLAFALWPTSSSAEDFAPESMAEMVYAGRITNPSGQNAPFPHAAVLLSDGSRTQINISGFPQSFGSATYTWTKTSAVTGTLGLTGTAVVSRLEIAFTTSGRGTFRQFTNGNTAVVEGEISFAPLPRDPTPPLYNLAARATLSAVQPAITGFVVDGKTPRRVLVRAIGPALVQFGVGNPVANPSLTVFKGNSPIAQNSGWGGAPSLAAVFSAAGAFALPVTSLDCAVVLNLEPGLYTTHVRGDVGSEVLLEVYFVN